MRKRIIAAVLCVLTLLTFTGCWDKKEVDAYAYVVAIGIDEGSTNNYKFTFSMANIFQIGGGTDEGGQGGEGEPLTNITVAATNMFSALNFVNSTFSKEINLTHTKLVVFSKNLAKKGLSKIIDGFLRDINVRSVTLMAVSYGESEELLNNILPTLEKNPERYINDLFEKNTSAFVFESTIFDFYVQSLTTDRSITVPMLGVLYNESSKEFKESSNYKSYNEDDVFGREMPKISENKVTIFGYVIFKGDKMIGTGTDFENIFHMLSIGSLSDTTFVMDDEHNIGHQTVVALTQRKKPDISVDVSKEAPIIKIDIDVEVKLLTRTNRNISEESYLEITQQIKKELEQDLATYHYKLSQIYKTDISGFGKAAKRKFLTWNDWMDYNWNEKFPKSIFVINVEPSLVKFGFLRRKHEH